MKPARVIKGALGVAPSVGSVASGAARLVKRVVLDAEEKASRRLLETEEQCAQLLKQAHDQADDARATAEREGYERGLSLAASQALHLAADSARADARAVPRMVEMARVLTEHLLGRAIELDPELVGQLALMALREVRSVHALQFECCPEDVTTIAAAFRSAGVGDDAVRVTGNAQLERGDFRLRSPSGVLEASLGSRLDMLCGAVLEGQRA